MIDYKTIAEQFYQTIVEQYPKLFEYKDGELYFIDELKVIYSNALRVIDINIAFEITPGLTGCKDFRLPIRKKASPNYFAGSDGFVDKLDIYIELPDHLCMLFYEYGLFIHGHDREAIMRRYTINNIINDNR